MRNFQKWLLAGAAAMAVAAIPHSAMAQANSNVGVVNLNATLAETLSVNVTSGPTVNFTLAPNTAANPGSTTSTVQTSWVLKPGRTAVAVWAWIPDNTKALTDGTNNIPGSAVSVAASGSGSAGGALNASPAGPGVPAFITGAAASGVQIGAVGISGANKVSSTTTTLTWNINTTFNTQLPASTYIGTVNIQAQATP